MEALFLKILNLSLSASWIVLGVILFRFIFRKAPKYIRGILWAVVALRLVCPFSIESMLSLIPSKEVIPETIIYSPTPQINSGIEAVDTVINPIITETFTPTPAASVNPLQIVNFVLACLWLIGIAVFLIYGVVNYISLYKRVSVSCHIGEGIYICDRIRTPFILGMIKPKIYLPSDIKDSEKGYVIAHERAHLKRLDHIFKPLGFLILAVYWFNPVIWLAYAIFCRDMELACDERVAKNLTAEEKKNYSETLLSFGLSDGIAKTFSPAFGEVGIRARIKTVLSYKKPAFWVILVALLLSVALAIGFLTDPVSDVEEESSSENSMEDTVDEIIPYTENWQDDYFLGEEFVLTAESGKNENVKAHIAKYNNVYSSYIYIVFEDGERVIIRKCLKTNYGDGSNDGLYLRDMDGDGNDEMILLNFSPRKTGKDTVVYKVTEKGFEEILNTKDLDYGYYLEPHGVSDMIFIKNKYVDGYGLFSSLSQEQKYFYDADGKFNTSLTLEYSDTQNTSFEDINGDGVFEIVIERYAVVKGVPRAVLTKTAFGYDGEKFSVLNFDGTSYYNRTEYVNKYLYYANSAVVAEIPAFEEGDTVSAEQFLLWFRLNEIYDSANSMITPYYQPYYSGGAEYIPTYSIPKEYVERVLKERFSVEFSSAPTSYDDGDFYNLSTLGFGPTTGVEIKSLEKKDDITVVKYSIISVSWSEAATEEATIHYDWAEIGELEMGIDEDNGDKIVYYRPKFYE